MERHFFSGGLKEKQIKLETLFVSFFKIMYIKENQAIKGKKIKTHYIRIIIAGCSFTVIMLNITEV